MKEFRSKMGENGRVVIPALCRQLMHLQPGDDLIIEVEDNELHLFTLQHSLMKARAIVEKHSKGKSLTELLINTRRKDAGRE